MMPCFMEYSDNKRPINTYSDSKEFHIALHQDKDCGVLFFLSSATISKNCIRLFTLLNPVFREAYTDV